MEGFRQIIELTANVVDAVGVLVLVIGALYASIRFLLGRKDSADSSYRAYRRSLGRAILLGLEFLVAADIIRTVAVSPTIEHVAALGLVVLIRTFLSVSIEVELEGRWPWQRGGSSSE